MCSCVSAGCACRSHPSIASVCTDYPVQYMCGAGTRTNFTFDTRIDVKTRLEKSVRSGSVTRHVF